jgi:Protein of unknown function (DUF5674)
LNAVGYPQWQGHGSLPRASGGATYNRARVSSQDDAVAPPAGVVVLYRRIDPLELARLVKAYFEDMVKYVVDVERGLLAVGGEMHVDGEQALLEGGSRQADLWGANYYPGRGRDGCIEYTALINIRPASGNRGMEIQDPELRERVREVTFALLGEGEPLP